MADHQPERPAIVHKSMPKVRHRTASYMPGKYVPTKIKRVRLASNDCKMVPTTKTV